MKRRISLWPLLPIFLTLGVMACQTPTKTFPYEDIREGLNARFQKTFVESGPYDIYYATNRDHTGDVTACTNAVYTVRLGQDMTYGLCRIQVPITRAVGSLSSGTDPNSDAQINFQTVQHEAYDGQGFAEALRSSPSDEILIFVHGFNVRFEEAVYRAAQLGFDGKYQGQVVLFSWPAGANDHILQGPFLLQTYKENKANAEASREAFQQVLNAALATHKRIHIVVHSMGHQVVLPALAQIAEHTEPGAIQELILNAPDFAIDDFGGILPSLKKLAKRTTIYCSPSDNALAASTRVNGNRRLGSCALFDGVDVIDVSEVDKPVLGVGGLGHGYYAGRPIIGDVLQLLLGMDADRRLFMRKTVPATNSNYRLRP